MVGLGKAPVREGAELFNSDGEKIGVVTSGTAGPTKGSPIAMGYVQTQYAVLDTEVFAEVRGKKLPMLIQRMPFVEQRYFRG